MSRRGMSALSLTGEIILVLVILMISVPLYGSVFKKAQKDLEDLGTCDGGLVASLAGEGAQCKCFNTPQCEINEYGNTVSTPDAYKGPYPPDSQAGSKGPFGGSRDYYWQYIGRGKGCPPKGAPTYEFACISVPKSQDPYSIADINNAGCENTKQGNWFMTRIIQDTDSCSAIDGSIPFLASPEYKFGFRYVPESGQKSCSVSITLDAGGSSSVKKIDCDDKFLVQLASAYDLLNQGEDKSRLNKGGKITVMFDPVPKVDQKTAVIEIRAPSKPYCSSSSVAECKGQVTGYRTPSSGECYISSADSGTSACKVGDRFTCDAVKKYDQDQTYTNPKMTPLVCLGRTTVLPCKVMVASDTDGNLLNSGEARTWICKDLSTGTATSTCMQYSISEAIQDGLVPNNIQECS